MFARPDHRGAPVGDYASTYESREDLADAMRTGTYREWTAQCFEGRGRGERGAVTLCVPVQSEEC